MGAFIAALVVAASFMPAVFLHAQGTGKPSDVAMGAGDLTRPRLISSLAIRTFVQCRPWPPEIGWWT